ncbi:MAG: CBS domain-containing protein [Luteolibacter sp.]
MKVHEIMSRNPYCCSPQSTLIDIASRMRDMDVGIIPVCEGKEMRGVITDRDIVIRAMVMGLNPAMTLAEQVMSVDVTCCFEDQDVGEAVALMEEKQIRRLVVLNRENQLVGMISLGDIAARGSYYERCGEALSVISKPSPMPAKLPGTV